MNWPRLQPVSKSAIQTCGTTWRHLGFMSTACIKALFSQSSSCPWLSCVIFTGQIPSPCPSFPSLQCQWSIKAYTECTLSNLLSVCTCVPLNSEAILSGELGLFRRQQIYSAAWFTFLAAGFVLVLTSTIERHFNGITIFFRPAYSEVLLQMFHFLFKKKKKT